MPKKKAKKTKPVLKAGAERKDAEEKALESFLFDDEPALQLGEAEEPAEEGQEGQAGASAWQDDDDEDGVEETGPKPAWVDEDDASFHVDIAKQARLRKLRTSHDERTVTGTAYNQKLQAKMQAMASNTGWAALPSQRKRRRGSGSDSDSDAEGGEEATAITDFLKTSESRVLTSSSLPPDVLNASRMKDANVRDPSQAVVQSLAWHPTGSMLMTAGMDKMIRLFEIDGVKNLKVQGIHIPDMPVHKAAFTADGSEIIASGRRKYYYTYDLHRAQILKIPGITGRQEKSLESFILAPDSRLLTFFGDNGTAVMVDRRSKHWIANLKMNGSLRAGSYSRDGSELYTFGGEGQVYVWDVRTQRCRFRFFDDGCVHGTAMAVHDTSTLGSRGGYLATGADSGVVNLYNMAQLDEEKARPTPLKAVMSLTTPVHNIRINHDAQLMAIASRSKKDCLKVVHLASRTVFSNWPTSSTPLHTVSTMEFSNNSGYLAVGNARGRVLLYRLNHFSSQ